MLVALVVGTRGHRVLDTLRFACIIVTVDPAGALLTVQYDDDGTIEEGVELDEFEVVHEKEDASTDCPRTQQPGISSMTEVVLAQPVDHAPTCANLLLTRVACFLDHVFWLQSLVHVCSVWHHTLQQAPQWRTLHARHGYAQRVIHSDWMTRLLGHRVREDSTNLNPSVKEVVTTLVLDDSSHQLDDAHVLALMQQCPHVTELSLRRCEGVSFLLLYDLLRLARERTPPLPLTVDLWLCPHISPSFVDQLMSKSHANENTCSSTFAIHGPGFFMADVATATRDELLAMAVERTGTGTGAIPMKHVVIHWLDRSQLLPQDTAHQSLRQDGDWLELRRTLLALRTRSWSQVPLVLMDSFDPPLSGLAERHQAHYHRLAFPASVPDLVRLVAHYETSDTVQALQHALADWIIIPSSNLSSETMTASPAKNAAREDSLAQRARDVFAKLHDTTQGLQQQVQQLEQQVATLEAAKRAAQQEYRDAERALNQVSKDADRALLRLALGESPEPPLPPAHYDLEAKHKPDSVTLAPPRSGVASTHSVDAVLPPLPSTRVISDLAYALEAQYFAILDSFLGEQLSIMVSRDVEAMYYTSCAPIAPMAGLLLPPPPPTSVSQEDPISSRKPESPSPMTRFQLGELAGGATGRNLRYRMRHVRGDYMLWVDEQDPFCPQSVAQVLRQLDRLVLERLAVQQHELSMTALLRKKAMLTCYPGHSQSQHSTKASSKEVSLQHESKQRGAGYTRHCDNPNKNGRKLTAILYLNRDWPDSSNNNSEQTSDGDEGEQLAADKYGGQLQLHVLASTIAGSSNGIPQAVTITPQLDRLVLFFSDRRVPHEVLPLLGQRDRFALTVWYLDYDEYMAAQVFGDRSGKDTDDGERERARIEREMREFARSHDRSV